MDDQPAQGGISTLGRGAVIVAALSLSACGTHMGKDRMGQPGGGQNLTAAQIHVLQVLDANGVNQQGKRVQVVKTCTNEPCDVDVKLSGTVTPTAGSGFDCNIGLSADALLFFKPVRKLSWVLKTAGASNNEFRFRPQPAVAGSPYAVSLYADPDYKQFSISLATDRVELTRQADLKLSGFLYGVYLDWRPKKGGQWQQCNALDPIILSMD